MTIKKFTMKEVDDEIMQIVQQQNTKRPVGAGTGPPNIIKSLLDRAMGKRNSDNGNAENQTQ